jgi:hypothetical protein
MTSDLASKKLETAFMNAKFTCDKKILKRYVRSILKIKNVNRPDHTLSKDRRVAVLSKDLFDVLLIK